RRHLWAKQDSQGSSVHHYQRCKRFQPIRRGDCTMNGTRDLSGPVVFAVLWSVACAANRAAVAQQTPPTFEEYLRKSVVDRPTLDVFLDPKQLSWAKFDSVTGYRLGNYMPKDGIDRSSTISTSAPEGMRLQHAYANRPCRINTYGDSFTLCHQVSDCETWQEY